MRDHCDAFLRPRVRMQLPPKNSPKKMGGGGPVFHAEKFQLRPTIP